MSIFEPKVPSGIFAQCPNVGGTVTALTFQRATREQNSAGELVLSFANLDQIRVDLFPSGRGVLRDVHGELNQVDYVIVGTGNLDLSEKDRTTISGALVEVIGVDHWGLETTEADLKYVR